MAGLFAFTPQAWLMTIAAAGAVPAQASAQAAPRFDTIFGDHAVVQRDRPVRVTGAATPGEALTVRLGDAVRQVKAGADGRFAAALPAMRAGGPYTLAVSGRSGQAEVRDVLIGDVFLCSGQSNMELPVERAQDGWNQAQSSADDGLRLFTVAKKTALTPQPVLTDAPGWAAASPTTTPAFSAACFYMAQELRRSQKVPVGAIHASWGGSAISAWMGDAAQRAGGRAKEADLLRLYARDPVAGARAAGAAWEDWWRRSTGDAPGKEPWRADAALAWKPVPKIGVWEQWGVPALADYNGMVWFRNVVTLTAAQAAQGATLAIGPVDDSDQTWVNGQPVGGGGNPGSPRVYPVPPGALHAGRNVIVVNASDSYANGGMSGPADAMRLTRADGGAVSLGAGWDYAVERRIPANPPHAPWDDIAGAGTIYNAMIAPLGAIQLRGVAWYQGESDVGLAGYADRMAAMMADWRRQIKSPTLPFAIVQLAEYGTPATQPGESGWAELREQQRLAAARDVHAALAIAVDLGDPLDIHPGEKHEVGRRLARAMRAIAYDAAESGSGPAIASATRTATGDVALDFTGVTGALATRSSDRAIGFELCGAGAGSCRFAAARLDGRRVVLAADELPATRVRYAWADSPVVNLFDAAQLPAGPFEIVLGRAGQP